MRVVQVAKPNAPFELVERPIPEPGPREARIKVEACGICYSDSYVVTGTFPGVRYPAVPGHEIAGRVDAVGSAGEIGLYQMLPSTAAVMEPVVGKFRRPSRRK